MNGYPNGAYASSADTSRASNGAGGPGGLYPSLAEIAAKASEKVDEVRQRSIRHILEVAQYHWTQAQLNSANRSASPAGAYWEYLVAYQLAVDVLPRHKDYYDKIDQSRNQMHRDFKQLLKEVRSNEERFMRIKQIILNENKRNGAAGQSVYPDPPPQHSRKTNGVASRPQDELMLPSVPTSAPTGRASPSIPSDHASRKPLVQPKPQSLHGRAVHQSISSINGGTKTDLAERFAKLRGTTTPLETSPRTSHDLSVKMPSPSDYHSSRPYGPRDMPPPSNPSIRPPKLPLDTQLAASLPKEPSPTYSPARNLILPSNINPPRSTARSMVGTGGRSNSLAASSASSHAPNTNGQQDSYFPTQPGIGEGPSTRRKSVHRPAELQITADKLYDYLRMYNVLLIDVRSRAEFDSGHIYVHSIMCIEPMSLQDGSSAEQLQDRLIISPDEEQIMYERRNEYDLVVYYDECSKTHAFLQKYNPNEKELALKRLFDTLYEFNHDKPLKRPPIFLMGGIEAWADLVGTQALKMSSTAAIVAGGHTRPRALRRTTAADRARLPLENRRRREYRPMDQEEQRKWLEEARKGRSVVEPAYDGEDEEEEATSPMYRTTEEFMRRFPDIEEQQSMMLPPSRPQPAQQYVAPSIPQAPSRPAPSVPRVSYSGVHERQLARQSSGTHSSLYVSPGRHGLAPLHRTGLMNFGVTCYMNSVIQCLSANASLTGLFLSGRYTQDLQKNNFKGTQGILPEAYATLLSNLYKGDMSALRPSTFRKVCGHFRRDWMIDEQQDAKEFLEFVLDFLHEDLNTAWDKHPLKELTDADELARERLPRQYAARIEWNRYLHRDNSLIGNLFAGQHASKLTCATCAITSTKYEAFWSISVEIPHDRACDVRDCLRSYCAAEHLDSSDSWRCPRCKVPREATKKITITRAPDTLVLHFKRFSADRAHGARKIRTPVHFPLVGLDVAPFMEPAITPEQSSYVVANARDAEAQLTGLRTDPAMDGPYLYNAYAVIWHVGNTLGSGHYIAFVKDRARGCWRSFNDERISDFEPGGLAEGSRLQNEKAYVVFYERERVAGGI